METIIKNTLQDKIHGAIKSLGFKEIKNFYNRSPDTILANYETEDQFIELFIERKNWYAVIIYGKGFMNSYYPTRIDITGNKDLKEFVQEMKRKLN